MDFELSTSSKKQQRRNIRKQCCRENDIAREREAQRVSRVRADRQATRINRRKRNAQKYEQTRMGPAGLYIPARFPDGTRRSAKTAICDVGRMISNFITTTDKVMITDTLNQMHRYDVHDTHDGDSTFITWERIASSCPDVKHVFVTKNRTTSGEFPKGYVQNCRKFTQVYPNTIVVIAWYPNKVDVTPETKSQDDAAVLLMDRVIRERCGNENVQLNTQDKFSDQRQINKVLPLYRMCVITDGLDRRNSLYIDASLCNGIDSCHCIQCYIAFQSYSAS